MQSVNQNDFVGGVSLAVFGAATAGYAYVELPLGTLRRMGPGLFPATIGLLLVIIGVFITLEALKGDDRLPKFEIRSAVAVVSGLSGFALTIDKFGLIVAILVLTLLCSFASRKLTLRSVLVISVTLCTLAWGIFLLGFNMPIRLLEWPF